jgi:hypothetical protein
MRFMVFNLPSLRGSPGTAAKAVEASPTVRASSIARPMTVAVPSPSQMVLLRIVFVSFFIRSSFLLLSKGAGRRCPAPFIAIASVVACRGPSGPEGLRGVAADDRRPVVIGFVVVPNYGREGPGARGDDASKKVRRAARGRSGP